VIKAALSLFAVVTAGALIGACGGAPGAPVATIDGEPIDQVEFDHWLDVAAASQGTRVPDVQNGYRDCIAAKRKAARGKQVSDGRLAGQCQAEYEQLRNQVLQLLISFRWIQGEANAQGITVTDAEVLKSFEEQKRESFPKESEYQKFLAQSHQTQEDILRRVRLDLLSDKLRDRVTAAVPPVTETQIRDFYAAHQKRFVTPERRDLRIVLTKDDADAYRARAALAAGQSWRAVAKRYSIDDTSKGSGGRLPGQYKGTLARRLDKAVFSARKGTLVGPIKTQFGYFVFTVTRIRAARKPSLAKARGTIKQTLLAEAQQSAIDAFVKDFTERWRAKTQCTKGFETTDCANGPAPTPTPTPNVRMR
jgi:foldase protein PrsA